MKKYIQAVLLLISIQLINIWIFIRILEISGKMFAHIFEIAFFFLVISDFFMLKNLYKNFQLAKIKQQLEIASEQKLMESAYEIKMKEWTKEIGKTRKVLKNLLLEVDWQLSNCSADKAIIFPLLDNISHNISKDKIIYFCDHTLTNIILADKYKIAEENNIAFSVQVIVPSELNASDSEICSIWCNLLDNAINACKLIESAEKRWIKVSSIIQNGYLYIKIENSTITYTGTNKKRCDDSSNIEHGYGLSILRELAVKHGGELILKQDTGRYISILTISANNCG